jgi:hypothetical protein
MGEEVGYLEDTFPVGTEVGAAETTNKNKKM